MQAGSIPAAIRDNLLDCYSNDKGFIRACRESENHLFFNSLGELYNAISKEDAAYDETMAIIKELQLRISAAVNEYIKGTSH